MSTETTTITSSSRSPGLTLSTAPQERTPILDLPLEVIQLILNELSFDSVRPFLEAYPSLKRHVLIFTNANNTQRFFSINGVTAYTGLPVRWAEWPNREVLLTLVNLIPEDYQLYYSEDSGKVNGFTAPVFERLMHGPSSVFIHSTLYSGSPVNPVYQSFIKTFTQRGMKICERVQESCENMVTLGSLSDLDYLLALSRYRRDTEKPLFSASFACEERRSLSGYRLNGLKSLTVQFPKMPGNERPVMSNLRLSSELMEFNVYYHGATPVFRNIILDNGGPINGPSSVLKHHFGLVDLDSETINAPPLHGTELHTPAEDVDLSFTENFESLFISGGDTSGLLRTCHLKKASVLRITECETSKSPLRPEEHLEAPELTTMVFKSRVAGSRVPTLNAPKLKTLSMSSSEHGLRYEEALESAPETIESLSILCSHTFGKPVVMVHGIPLLRFKNLTHLDLQEVSAPFIEDPQFEMKKGKVVKLTLVKEIDVNNLPEGGWKPYIDRYLSDELHFSGFNDHAPSLLFEALQCLPKTKCSYTHGWTLARMDKWINYPFKLHMEEFVKGIYVRELENILVDPEFYIWVLVRLTDDGEWWYSTWQNIRRNVCSI